MKALIARHDRMLEFIKELTKKESKDNWYDCSCDDAISYDALKLLEELAHIKAENL